jgi:putative DNA primase/helicase
MNLSKHQIESLPARPVFSAVNLDVIPRTLREHVQWVLWKYDWHADRECWTKVPYSFRDNPSGKGGRLIHSKSTARELWMGWAQALDRRARMDGRGGNQLGIGFVLAEGGGIVCIDLDDCRNRDTGEITPGAMAIITEFDTYTEVSPSGTGVKLFLRGSKTCNRSKNVEREIEVYESKRFVAMTGHLLPGLPAEPMPRQEQLDKLTRELFPSEYEPAAARGHDRRDPTPGMAPAPNLSALSLSDADVIERASNASNGMKFRSLWAGDDSAHNGDRSSADLALACMLAFWVGPDESRIESIMRQSGLVRGKWDRADYMRRTIARALSGRGSYYGDRSAKWQELEEELASMPPMPKGWFTASLELMRAKKREREEAERKAQMEAARRSAPTPEEIAAAKQEEERINAVTACVHRRRAIEEAEFRCRNPREDVLRNRDNWTPWVQKTRCYDPDCCGCRVVRSRYLADSMWVHWCVLDNLYMTEVSEDEWKAFWRRADYAEANYARVRDVNGLRVSPGHFMVIMDRPVSNVGRPVVPVEAADARESLRCVLMQGWDRSLDRKPLTASQEWTVLDLSQPAANVEWVGPLREGVGPKEMADIAYTVGASIRTVAAKADSPDRVISKTYFHRPDWTDETSAATCNRLVGPPPDKTWRGAVIRFGLTTTIREAITAPLMTP